MAEGALVFEFDGPSPFEGDALYFEWFVKSYLLHFDEECRVRVVPHLGVD